MSHKKFVIGGASAIALTLSLATTASAQQPQDDALTADEVIVTGSRIARQDLVANSPVSVIDVGEIETSANVEIDRILDVLPQTVSSNGPTTNNPGNGAATVNLRNLGTVRTLVLQNGRRFVGESATGVVDLNNIPPALIERIEVVTGGASAVYGSDAMAGVVNFILKDDFEGAELSAQYGITERGDSQRINLSGTLGTNFANDRGNVVLSANYFDREQTFATERDFAAVQFGEGTDANGNPIFTLAGSPTAEDGRFTSGQLTGLTDSSGNAIGTLGVFADPAGNAVAFTRPRDDFNFAPFNNLQLPLKRIAFAANGDYEITPNIEVFTELNFTNTEINRTLAPTPFAGVTLNVDLDNPFIPASLLNLFQQVDANEAATGTTTPNDGIARLGISRRMLEVGNRVSQDTRNLYRGVFGLRGEVFDDHNWEVFYNIGRSEEVNRQTGNVIISAFQQGLLVSDTDPTQCADTSGGCVVLNPFGAGNFTQAMSDFVAAGATNTTFVEQQQFGANLTGSLFTLPAGDFGYAVGVEHRIEEGSFTPDTFLASGDIRGFNAGQPTNGEYDVTELYGEVLVPLIADRTGIQYLAFEGGYRYSDYSNVGGVNSYKLGGEWNPVDDFKVRGLYQRAVRAPNINELFLGSSNSFPGGTDFCNATGANRTQAEADFCVNQLGVPAAQIATFAQEANQIEVLLGGNPNLEEETSDTFTVGFAWSPSQLPGFFLTADYYDISVDNAISVLGGSLQGAIDVCRNGLDISSPECQVLTTRDEAGQLRQVPLLNANISNTETSGVDVSARYGFEGFGGDIDLVGALTHVIKNDTQANPVASIDECAGLVGVRSTCGRADPEWRVTSRATYSQDNWNVSLRYRYIGEVTDERVAFGTRDASATVIPVIGDEHLFDLSGRYDLLENLEIFANIDNLFDNEPPIFGRGATGQLNTDAGTYDVLGRRYTVGFRASF